MRALTIILFAAVCASAQPLATDTDVPRLLADHGVKSATEFADFYQTFQTAARAIPAATAEMERAILCAKKRSDVACANADASGTAILRFQAARFNLRKSHYQADEARNEMVLEIIGRSFVTSDTGRLNLSSEECSSVQRYLKEAKRNLDQNFTTAELQWRMAWRHAEKTILRHGQ